MIAAVVIILLAAIAVVARWRRGRPQSSPPDREASPGATLALKQPPVAAPVPAPVTNLGEAIAEMRPQSAEDELAFQVDWLRRQQSIETDSILTTVQRARSSIRHVGEESPVRAVLDHLEQQAKDCPAGVPGSVVANARLEFDRLMRANVQ